MNTDLRRRHFLKSSVVLTALVSVGRPAGADVVAGKDGFPYEVTKTDAEWKAQLGDYAFGILREGKTEPQNSSPLVEDQSAGRYDCKACTLPIYHSKYRVITSKGWMFYRVAEPNSVLTGIDGPEGATMDSNLDVILAENPSIGGLFSNEVHCRRCGSHMGHILLVEGQVLHCINGTSLTFHASEPT
ncbi:MAG: hypothetical protein GW905_04520 [Rhodobacterales bacterium]|nr:hypothetical protein [Rhodobacterales bacterium]